MKIITWDTEIMEMVENQPNGWDDARNGLCGISCVCLYDTDSARYHTYSACGLGGTLEDWHDEDLDAMMTHLNSADLLVGFNTIAFDTPALQGFTGIDVQPEQYDLLHEIWGAVGRKYKGFSLNDLCLRHGLGQKSGTGAGAPSLYQSGRFGALLDYCLGDVALTRKLINYVTENGSIQDAEGSTIELRPLGIPC